MKLHIWKNVNNWMVSYKKSRSLDIIPPVNWVFATFENAVRFVRGYMKQEIRKGR